jgi:hypothetical protein
MYKRIIPAVVIGSLLCTISLFAFTNTSFRNASTAMLLEDDYDLWLGPYPLPDPARLPLIEGSRLYTNLSNFINKGEEQFGPYTSNYFLIGGSTTPLFNMGHLGIVVDRYNDRDAWDTGLTDMINGAPLFGFGHVVHSYFVDEDNNGTYDRRTDIEETAEAWQDDGSKDLVFCFGRDMGTNLFGLFYEMNVTNLDIAGYDGAGDPVNFTCDSTETNLISGDRTFTQSTVGTGSTDDDMTEHTFGLSFWRYLSETNAAGVHFGYGMFSGTYHDMWDVTDDWDGSPDDPGITDTYAMDEASDENIPVKGNSMTAWLSYIHDWNEITHLRFDGYYNTRSFDVESDAARDYTIDETRNAADNSSYTNNGSEATVIAGDGSAATMAFRGKVIYDLTDRVTFAFGAGFTSRTFDSTLTEDSDAQYVYTYDDGDTQANDPDDYTATTTFDDEIQAMTTDVTTTVSFPVCVEFNVFKPLDFRLGAIHNITRYEKTTNEDLLDYSAAVTHTVYGDGTESYVINPNPNLEDIGSSEDHTTSGSSTIYTYGMGYKVSDNLMIDLMMFYDLTDLRDWRLSATMSF